MMGALIAAWLVGEGIIVYRSVKTDFTVTGGKRVQVSAPPGPGELLVTSGVFVLLALMAEFESARPLAIALAWGFDIAALMTLDTSSGQTKQWPPATAPNNVVIPTSTAAAGTSTAATAAGTGAAATGSGTIAV